MSESSRIRLARLARDAALGVPGVADTLSGRNGSYVTLADGERLDGVMCAAAPGGGYDVSLRLRCELVALGELAQRVQAAVTGAGEPAGLPVASVHVDIVDVVDPEGS